MLSQPFPNPSTGHTTIRFQIPHKEAQSFPPHQQTSLVSLKVYDLLGREVTTLIEGALEAETQSVEWDASAVKNGVYFYRLVVDGGVEMKKIVVER